MIPVSLSTMLILGMSCGVGLLGLMWIYSVWRERRLEKRARRDLVQCRICGGIYENAEKKSLTACPACGSLNESAEPRPI